MTANKIANSDLLDILFDERNKAYGAYTLRREYNKHMTIAIGAVIGIGLVIFFSATLAKGDKTNDKLSFAGPDVTLKNVEEPIVKPAVLPDASPRQVETIRNPVFTIVPDNQVQPDDMPPPVTDIADAYIGLATIHGDIDDGTLVSPPLESGTGATILPVRDDNDDITIFKKVEIEPEFQGDWKRFLERNLQYPEEAVERGTQGIVRVQFVVDRTGAISDIIALNDPGDGLADEAIRIIKKSPLWKPAEQNGRKVKYMHIQAITFRLE